VRFRAGLNCQEVVELVTEYLEGALGSRASARFERHLAGCPDCRAYVEQMRGTLGVIAQVEPEALDPRLRDELVEAFRDWRHESEDER
jgi:predicted anti-sigma-YlaC factor YlaD